MQQVKRGEATRVSRIIRAQASSEATRRYLQAIPEFHVSPRLPDDLSEMLGLLRHRESEG